MTRADGCPTVRLTQENFFVQVLGEKRWLLAPPAAYAEMYVLPGGHPSGRQSALDWPHVNTTAYPRATAKADGAGTVGIGPHSGPVGLLETRLKPKEVLYCPPVWFHGTEAIGPGPNLGLSFWSESGKLWSSRRCRACVLNRRVCACALRAQRRKLVRACYATRSPMHAGRARG